MNPEFHTCPKCGHEWKHGQDGSHSCSDKLFEQRNSALAALQDIHAMMDEIGISKEPPGIRARVRDAVENLKKTKSDITIVKTQPAPGNLYFISYPPFLTDETIQRIEKQIFETIGRAGGKYILLPFKIEIETMSGEKADWLAEEILKKINPTKT